MQFELIFSDQVPKIAILVSKLPHCLQDLRLRHRAGELKAEIALIISNHTDAAPIAEAFGMPFRHFPIRAENRLQQEIDEIKAIKAAGVQLLVLARYMQVHAKQRLAMGAGPKQVVQAITEYRLAKCSPEPCARRTVEKAKAGLKLAGSAEEARNPLDRE